MPVQYNKINVVIMYVLVVGLDRGVVVRNQVGRFVLLKIINFQTKVSKLKSLQAGQISIPESYGIHDSPASFFALPFPLLRQ
jgi:hypothetical protein